MEIGTTLSQTRLSIHAARSQTWVRLQGNVVNVRGETWQANFYNGGRIQSYTLVCIESGGAAQGAQAMKRSPSYG